VTVARSCTIHDECGGDCSDRMVTAGTAKEKLPPLLRQKPVTQKKTRASDLRSSPPASHSETTPPPPRHHIGCFEQE